MIGAVVATGFAVLSSVLLGIAWWTARERYLWWALFSCIITLAISTTTLLTLEGSAS